MNVKRMIERLRLIPDSGRDYACTERFAQLHFGLDANVLRMLVEGGLPFASDNGYRQFEYGDLHYIGLRLRSATTFLWAVERWVASLEMFTRRCETSVAIAYLPQLAGQAGEVSGVVRLPGGERRTVTLQHSQRAVEVRVVLARDWPELPPVAARIADEVAESVEFCLLPTNLRGNTGLVREIGLSDCLTAAQLIVEEWQTAGLDARIGSGLLVSNPYSTIHSWPETRVGEVWVPADPLTLGVMRNFGGLNATTWPVHRSVGPMLMRVGEEPGALILTESGGVAATYLTSISDAGLDVPHG